MIEDYEIQRDPFFNVLIKTIIKWEMFTGKRGEENVIIKHKY